MPFYWTLSAYLCILLGLVSSVQQDIFVNPEKKTKEHQLVANEKARLDVLDSHDTGELTVTKTFHFKNNDENSCLKLERKRIVPAPGDDNEHGEEEDLSSSTFTDDETSTLGKKDGSGWLLHWVDGIFENNVDSISNESGGKSRESAVRVLQRDGDFEKFIKMGQVVIVFFYKYSSSESLDRFLTEYDTSANHLLQYDIFLGLVDCIAYSVGSYCSSEKVNRFAYGFREGQEKIAFPLDTLFNNNAIVASALHLDLINSVPILQTALERREIERRCKGRCDIVFSFQRTLGTYEHRMFLEIAHAYQDNFVFAITTYAAGTLGLSTPDSQINEDTEQRVWVVHCADKSINEQCVVSYYRHKMLLPEMLQFLAALLLPKWHELEVSPSLNTVVTPYDGTSLPWVILIYDTSNKHRVISLAPDLAQLLHGTVATITLDIGKISDEAVKKLRIERNQLVTPAVAFLHQGQETTLLLNDYDDPLEWINEQLTTIFEHPTSKADLDYQPVHALDELVQDDEVVMGMQREETFVHISPLSGPEAYTTVINANELTVIAFYLSWDPVSNTLLQLMNDISPILVQWGSKANLQRLNCFDWPRLCDSLGIAGYPELRIYLRNGQNFTYNGPIYSECIAKAILLHEKSTPLELKAMENVNDLLELKPHVHIACHLLDAVAVGIFPSKEDAKPFIEAVQSLRASHLTGFYISKKDVTDIVLDCANFFTAFSAL